MNEEALIFTTPNIKYKDAFIEGIKEFQKEGRHIENNFQNIEDLQNNFEKYIEKCENESKGIDLKIGRVPQTIYWLIIDGKYIGRVSIRHTLNDNLLKMGGYIGYDVVPSERKKGYGTELLKYALLKSKEMGLQKVLLTCDEDNVGSRKIIEKCGGMFENILPAEGENPAKCRFWIDLKYFPEMLQ